MTDLERFFRRLVANLAGSDPARLHRPIPLEDIHESIVPYRSNRRALQLESSEDYELVLLRLCAGEGGLVRTEPEEARARFAEELQSPNPDLHVLHQVRARAGLAPVGAAGPRARPRARARSAVRAASATRRRRCRASTCRRSTRSTSDSTSSTTSRPEEAPDDEPATERRTASTAATASPPTGRCASVPTAASARRRPSVPSATARSSPAGGTA